MSVKGIDISEHQGAIDFQKVKNSGIEFVMIRMGFGSDDPSQDDSRFEQNVAGCEAVGLPWGAYLYSYALTTADAKSEASHALRLLEGKHPTYPISFDMEDADNYKTNNGMPSYSGLVDICNTFLSIVECSGYKVSLYACKYWMDNQLASPILDKYSKWVAEWNDKCTYIGKYDMWQYTSDGAVDGINGRVDMNISYKDVPVPAPQPAPEPTPIPENIRLTYVVQAGDTLGWIASQYNTTYQELAAINGIPDPNLIYPGQVIQINGQAQSAPPQGNYINYTVVSGDSLWSIAQKFLGDGSRYPEIKELNGLQDDVIYTDQVVKVGV